MQPDYTRRFEGDLIDCCSRTAILSDFYTFRSILQVSRHPRWLRRYSSTRIPRTADQDLKTIIFVTLHTYYYCQCQFSFPSSSDRVLPSSDDLCSLASREPVGFWTIGSAFWISFDSL